MTKSMWNLPEGEVVVGPVQIVREQLNILQVSTDDKLQGMIQTSGDAFDIANDFNIVIPALGFYSYTLARYVQKPTAIYPGRLYSALVGDWVEIPNESVFREELQKLLGSDEVRDLIKTLLSQVS